MDKVPELDTDHQDAIMDCLAVRQGDIQNALLEEKCAVSGPILEDFDWKIKACDIHLKLLSYLLNPGNRTFKRSLQSKGSASLQMNMNFTALFSEDLPQCLFNNNVSSRDYALSNDKMSWKGYGRRVMT